MQPKNIWNFPLQLYSTFVTLTILISWMNPDTYQAGSIEEDKNRTGTWKIFLEHYFNVEHKISRKQLHWLLWARRIYSEAYILKWLGVAFLGVDKSWWTPANITYLGPDKRVTPAVVFSHIHGGSTRSKSHCTSIISSLARQQTLKQGIKPELRGGQSTQAYLPSRLKQGCICIPYMPPSNGKFRVIIYRADIHIHNYSSICLPYKHILYMHCGMYTIQNDTCKHIQTNQSKMHSCV